MFLDLEKKNNLAIITAVITKNAMKIKEKSEEINLSFDIFQLYFKWIRNKSFNDVVMPKLLFSTRTVLFSSCCKRKKNS